MKLRLAALTVTLLWLVREDPVLKAAPTTEARQARPAPLAAGSPSAPAPKPEAGIPRPIVPESVSLESEHFTLVYRPDKLSAEHARQARWYAERGWQRCVTLFGPVIPGKVRLELTPEFTGASGVAFRGDPSSADPMKRPRISIRYAELDYLGLDAQYLFTHEIAHIFSGALAANPLGEGIADWAAAGFAGITMRPGWGRALREAGLWVSPDALFITGEFEAGPEEDARLRTARYVESALLVRYLVERFGWNTFHAFATDYGEVRAWLGSTRRKGTQPAARISAPMKIRITPLPPPATLPDLKSAPSPEDKPAMRVLVETETPPAQAAARGAQDVRRLFERHFGVSWEVLRGDWERRMEQDPMPREEAQRLVLSQQIYGAVRSYEMWKAGQKRPLNEGAEAAIRRQFIRTNRMLREGDLKGAGSVLRQAQALVEHLRRGNRP